MTESRASGGRRPRALATTPCFVVSDLSRALAFYEDLEAEMAALRGAGIAIERGPTRTEYPVAGDGYVSDDGHRRESLS